jgi:hypothetical protein
MMSIVEGRAETFARLELFSFWRNPDIDFRRRRRHAIGETAQTIVAISPSEASP